MRRPPLGGRVVPPDRSRWIPSGTSRRRSEPCPSALVPPASPQIRTPSYTRHRYLAHGARSLSSRIVSTWLDRSRNSSGLEDQQRDRDPAEQQDRGGHGPDHSIAEGFESTGREVASHGPISARTEEREAQTEHAKPDTQRDERRRRDQIGRAHV